MGYYLWRMRVWIVRVFIFPIWLLLRFFKQKPKQELFTWGEKLIINLDNKHLYNIVMAMHRGEWKTYNTPMKIKPELRVALLLEYKSRKLNKLDIEKIELENKKYRLL